MGAPIQSRTRLQMRHSIGYNVNDVIVSEATSTEDTDTLIDTYGLAKGGDDNYNGRQVCIYDATGSIVDGEKSFVSDFAIATFEATMLPAFSANITDGDKYEMWRILLVEEINEIIDQAIIEITDKTFVDKESTDTLTVTDTYAYDVLSGFDAVYEVSYLYNNSETTATKKVWRPLPLDAWKLTKGTTKYLELTEFGYSMTGAGRYLRLQGLTKPSLLTTDASVCEVNPSYVLAFGTARLMIGHSKSSRLDSDNRLELSEYWAGELEKEKKKISSDIPANTRWV